LHRVIGNELTAVDVGVKVRGSARGKYKKGREAEKRPIVVGVVGDKSMESKKTREFGCEFRLSSKASNSPARRNCKLGAIILYA